MDFFQQCLEDVVQFLARLLHPQPHEAQAGFGVEYHDQDDAVPDELDVNVRLLTFVELGGELLLLEQLGHPAGGGDVAGRQRRQAGRVDVVDVAGRGDELSVLVDDEDDLGVRVPNQAVHDPLDQSELLLVHHHLPVDHSILDALTSRIAVLAAARIPVKQPRRVPLPSSLPGHELLRLGFRRTPRRSHHDRASRYGAVPFRRRNCTATSISSSGFLPRDAGTAS